MHLLDMIGSFIIGGLLLLAIMGLFLMMNSSSHSNTFSHIQQMTATEFGSVLEYDLNKVGYRVQSGNKIVSFDSTGISFFADLNNDGVMDSVTYSRTGRQPNFQINRLSSLSSGKTFALQVADFRIKGYTMSGAATWERDQIRTIEVQMLVQKQFHKIDGKDSVGTYWVRRFFPKNL